MDIEEAYHWEKNYKHPVILSDGTADKSQALPTAYARTNGGAAY